MYGMFIADTDKENINMLCGFLTQKHAIVPDVWQNSRGYQKFLDESESAIVFIRVDNCAIPGLELTKAAMTRGDNIHVIWMSESEAYALEAFRYGAEAYLLLPATEEILRKTINSFNRETTQLIKKERI